MRDWGRDRFDWMQQIMAEPSRSGTAKPSARPAAATLSVSGRSVRPTRAAPPTAGESSHSIEAMSGG